MLGGTCLQHAKAGNGFFPLGCGSDVLKLSALSSLQLHVESVTAQVLVELAKLQQLRSVTNVLLCVVPADTASRPSCTWHTVLHHLPLFDTFNHAKLSPLLCGFAVGCHG